MPDMTRPCVTGLPSLSLHNWQLTRNTIQGYTQVVGKIRRVLSPPQKHWGHASLFANASGLTTSPIPDGLITFEIRLEFSSHQVIVINSLNEKWCKPLRGQPVATFYEELLVTLKNMGVVVKIDGSLFEDQTHGFYDFDWVERYWRALSWIDARFKRFKGELHGETSPVQIWPHHFDLAMLWFSGRKVPGVDPQNDEYADEQMNFGFSSGDEEIPEAYFYATSYPVLAGLDEVSLPSGAYWHRQGWQGAVMAYADVVSQEDPEKALLSFLHTVQRAGASLMMGGKDDSG